MVYSGAVRSTRYFREQVLRKRPYLKEEWCEAALAQPIRSESQPDGRKRFWTYVEEIQKYLRVVTLKDGVTIHNAFPDRNFEE